MPDRVGPKTLVQPPGRQALAGLIATPAERFTADSGQICLTTSQGVEVVGWAPAPWLLDAEQFGGYAQTNRTARRGIVNYEGVDAVSMSGTILLDGWGSRAPVSQQVRDLRAMASPSGPRELTPPAPVYVTGTVEVPRRWWVIASLTPGRESGSEVALRASDGVALRRAYAVVLVQPPTDAVLLTNGKRYTSRAGDTPLRVASTQLGKASRWKELKTSAGKRFKDPKKRLKVGSTVILP
jgi:hypothetical protein